MMKKACTTLGFFALLILSTPALALDSYRYFKVTIDGPWMIFLFLLPIVLSPLILMAILYWHFARVKAKQQHQSAPAGEIHRTPGA